MYHWDCGIVTVTNHFILSTLLILPLLSVYISGDVLKPVAKRPRHAAEDHQFDNEEFEAGGNDSEPVSDELVSIDGGLQLSRASARIFAQVL